MTTAYTSLLGLALPVTGELSGTWGDVVNNSITSLVDTSVAGTTNISTDANVTLTTTTGASNQARQAILLFSGARTAIRTVTAPAQSKIYTVINATTGGFAVTLVGAGPTTGVTIANGARTVVAWNGSDFVEVSSPSSIILPGGTANGVLYLNGSKVVTSGSALTFDGTNFFGGTNTYVTGRFYAQRSSSSLNLPIAGYTDGSAGAVLSGTKGDIVAFGNAGGDGVIFANSNTEGMRLTSTGLGIGTSSPSYKLQVTGAGGTINTSVGTNTTSFRFLSANTTSEWTFGNNSTGIENSGDYLAWNRLPNGGSWSELMRLNSSGNLGLGVTPSAWSSSFRALQVKNASLWSTGNDASLTANAYYDGTNYRYIGTNGATRQYHNTDGSIAWYTAASGTAGNAITFTQAMTLDASGNLRLGLTGSVITSTERMSIQSASGSVGLAINAAGASSYGIGIYGSQASGATSQTMILFQNSSSATVGSITSNGTATAYNVTSDQRQKDNIQDAAPASSLIDAIQVRQYDWKSDGSHQRYGFIAQELVTVAPEAVHQPADPDDMMAVDYSKLVPMLVKEIQSLRKRLTALEGKA